MTSHPDEIRGQIEETRTSLSQDVNTLADTVNPAHAAKRTVASARSAVTGVKDKVMGSAPSSAEDMSSAAGDKIEDMSSAAGDKIAAAGSKVSAVPQQLRRQASGNPLAVGLIALGTGWLLGSLLPASDTEEQAAAKVKEAARPAVTGAAREAAANLQDAAQEAAESVRATAADAAITVKDETTSSAQDLREQAQDARDQMTDTRR